MSTEANSSITTLMLPVKFTESQLSRFWSKVDKTSHPNGCWIWTASKDQRGYGRFETIHDTAKSHRISWMIKNGFLPKSQSCRGVCILHKCDNPSCVNPDHLETGTQADNMKDAAKKGRMPKQENTGPALHPECMPRGESHWSKRFPEKWAEMQKNRLVRIAELHKENPSLWKKKRPHKNHVFKLCTSIQTAWEIRAMHFGGGWSQRELSIHYGIGRSVMSKIINGKFGWRALDEKSIDMRCVLVDSPLELYQPSRPCQTT